MPMIFSDCDKQNMLIVSLYEYEVYFNNVIFFYFLGCECGCISRVLKIRSFVEGAPN